MASLLDLLPTLLRTVPAVAQGMKGVDLKQQAQTTADMRQLSAAQSDTSNPLYQHLLQQNRQQGQTNLADTIAQLQSQNRLAVSSGQSPLLNQERGSEGVFRNLIKGQEDVGNQAVGQTYSQIGNAMTGLQNNYSVENNLANANYGNTQKQTAAYGTLGDALQGLFGLGKGQQQVQSSQYLQQPQQNQYYSPMQRQSGNQLLPTNYGSISNGGY